MRPLPVIQRVALPLLAIACLLGGCARDDAAVDADAAQDPVPEPAAPPEPTAASVGEATWAGYADTLFGMTADEVRAAWPGPLEAAASVGTCYHLHPAGQPSQAHFALMIEDDKFVRYSVANSGMTAPGGARVGMDEDAIEDLYPRLRRTPHAHIEGGESLRVKGESERVLIMDTNADDIVTEWRVGQMPQVAYPEGCS